MIRKPTRVKQTELWVRLGQRNNKLPITLDNLFQIALPVVAMTSGNDRARDLLEEWLDYVTDTFDFTHANIYLFRLIDEEAQ